MESLCCNLKLRDSYISTVIKNKVKKCVDENGMLFYKTSEN